MSLKGAIASGVAAAFDAIGDLKTDVVYYQQTQDNPSNRKFNPKTGYINIRWNIITSIQGLLTRTTQSRIISDESWTIKPGDQFLLIQANELNLEPSVGDECEIKNDRWRVENTAIDPALAMWIFQIRKTSYPKVQSAGSNTAISG